MLKNILLFQGREFNANFFYLSKVNFDNSFYLKLGKNEFLFVPKLNERMAKLFFKGQVCVYEKLEDIARFIKNKEIGLDFSVLPVKIYEKLKKSSRVKDVSDQLLKERSQKKPCAIEKIKKAVLITKKIFSEIELSEFKNESELSNFLITRTFELGSEPAFKPIVGSGANSAFPHYHTGTQKIKDFVLIDYGARYENYCSDISRVFFLKKNKKISQMYEKLQHIFYEIIDAFDEFQTGKDIAIFSEKTFKKHNLPKPIHSIGHGVGLDVHEYPRLNKKYSDELNGTVMTIEPAVYLKNFGLRFEETVYFNKGKIKIF